MKTVMMVFAIASGTCFAQEEIKSQKNSENRKQQMEIEVSVYPNPTHGNLYIDGADGTKVIIYSLEGTYIGTWLIGSSGKVEITDLPIGTFICELHNNETLIRKRIVVL